MKYTLVQASFKNYASKQPPLGLAYIAAVLRNQGEEIEVIDSNVERLTTEDTIQRIIDSKPDVIGFTVTTPLFGHATKMARIIKEKLKNVILVAGGPHPTVLPEDVMKTGAFDYVIRKEGEETIKELNNHLKGNGNLEDILGLSFRKDGKIIHNTDRPLIENLDKLPFPAWEFFKIKLYRGALRKTNFALPIMTSRGCPFGCIFCYKGIYGRIWRERSPESVIKEIKYLKEKFHIKELSVLDDNFTLKIERSIKICDRMIEEKLNIIWCTPNGIRVDFVNHEVFQKMKQSGCYRIYLAVECGDEEVIKYVNKGINLTQVRKAFKLAKESNLEVGAFFMIGNLSETEETMQKTIDLAIELDPDFAQFTIATPYPGTVMYQRILQDGKLLINSWEDFTSFDTAIFEYKNLNPELIERMQKKAIRSFYMRPKFITKYLRKNMSLIGIKNLFTQGMKVVNLMIKGELR